MDWTRIDDATAFVADPLPDVAATVRIEGSVPDTEPLPFDVTHDDDRLLLGTNRSLTRCLPATERRHRNQTWDVPMGYTQLYLFEKRAVAWRGELARVWPGGVWQSGYAIIADGSGRPMRLGMTHPLRFALRDAVELSRLIDGGVLLVRLLEERAWH